METELKKILKKLDDWIEKKNRESWKEGFAFNPNCEITILGQMGLLIDREIALVLKPIGTVDLDAKVKADGETLTKLKDLLFEKGYVLDQDSDKIWLPKESKKEPFYEGNRVTCYKIKPLYLLVSKAIKAKEKNKPLIADAIAHYQDELVELIEKYGGDPRYFLED